MEYNFGPANEGEQIVYGSERPGFDFHSVGARDVSRWITFMRTNGIKRVCCLLAEEQLDFYDVDLLGQYRREFGPRNVCSAAIPDRHLCDAEILTGKILPFLQESDQKREPVVVHCSGGSGRTGHILSAWLVHARGLSMDEALSQVKYPRRNPLEAIIIGNASMAQLRTLLAKCQEGSAA
jgi:protein-tyrosine phosphatase